jgi:preprotein translocase subunit SecF
LIGLLTIMAFSLYDTVIVFDKVQENTQGFEHTTRRTFAEQANLAINQTFMRSINTTLISITPVISLMIIAVWLLGVGTLKDLALVMLVGVICGAYGSIFFATPLLVSMRERTDLVRTHTRRVMNRRKGVAAKAVAAGQDDEPEAVAAGQDDQPVEAAPVASTTASANKPAPGARPVRPTASRTGRPSGKRNTRQR